MPRSARPLVAPVYLFGCLLLGGAVEGIWRDMILQLAGLAIIAWAAAAPADALPARAKSLLLLMMMAVATVAVEAVPLPPSIWAHGVRAHIAEDYLLLGSPVPAIPWSLSPYSSLATLLCIIPPLAILCAMMRWPCRPRWFVASLLGGTFVSIVMSIVQASTGTSGRTNTNAGAGLFDTPDHMAILLVIALAFVIPLAISTNWNVRRSYMRVTTGMVTLILALVGLALTNSAISWALAIPVFVLGTIAVGGRARGLHRLIMLIGAVFLIAAAANLTFGEKASRATFDRPIATTGESRQEILGTTARAALDFIPLGSGLGSFVRVYPLYERFDAVTSKKVLHAYNDYAELALELGLPGIGLVIAFLIWWTSAVRHSWRAGEGTAFMRAASIASAVVLLDSAVDFPLRTAAISAVFGMCLGFLASREPRVRPTRFDLRPARHVVIS